MNPSQVILIDKEIEVLSKDETNELTPLKVLTELKKEKTQSDAEKKISLRERFKLFKENITVEPILACYVMPSVLASLATQNLNLEKACRVNLNFSNEVCDALYLRQTENYTKYEEEVQILTASVQNWKNIIQTALPVILILFVGAWSDKTGRRKPCILIPIVGEFLTCVGLMLNTYFFYELPVEVAALTESIFPAITGGWYTSFVGTFSYIGDITNKEDRTYRVGLVNLCTTLAYPIGSALSGVLLNLIGYYGIFLLSASLYMVALVYGFFYLHDSKPKPRKETEKVGILKEFFDLNLVKETIKVTFRKGPGHRRLRVSLLLIVVCVVFGPATGEYTIMYLFTRYRFNWDEVQFSIWSTYAVVTNLFGTLFSMSVFTKAMKLDDTLVGIISNISKIIGAFGYAFARNNLEIYLAPLLEILNGTAYIAMRSIALKLVSEEEFGKVNSLYGLAEASMPLIYGPMYSRVYMATLNYMPGAVFLLGAGLTLPSIGIFGWLYFEHKKDIARNEANKVLDCETKEHCEKIKIND